MRIYFCGNIGVGKTTIMTKLMDLFQQNKVKSEIFLEPLSDWEKLLKYKSENLEDSEICALADNLLTLFLLKQRINIKYQKDTIYLMERDFECCKMFRNYKSEKAQELSNDFLQQCYEFGNYNNTSEMRIFINSDVDTIMSRINNRNRDFEKQIPETYIKHLNDLHHERTYDLIVDNTGELDSEEYNNLIKNLYEIIIQKIKDEE